MTDLKPCPFCGADNVNLSIEYDDCGDPYICCNVCDSFYTNGRLDNLIDGWNRRAKE